MRNHRWHRGPKEWRILARDTTRQGKLDTSRTVVAYNKGEATNKAFDLWGDFLEIIGATVIGFAK